MARAKYQVLVLPYKKTNEGYRYGIFKRSDLGCWQFIAGGGETEDASVMVSAQREASEEAGIPPEAKYSELETRCSISAEHFSAREIWGRECLVIPEYSFAVDCADHDIRISHEHTVYEWVDYDTAMERLKYDSNRVALWELDNKLKMEMI